MLIQGLGGICLGLRERHIFAGTLLRCILISPASPVAGATLVCFAIKEEIAENATGTPKVAICPALDAALVLIEDKDRARGDHFTLRIDETTRNAGDEAPPGSLEDEQGIARGLNPATPRRLRPGSGHRLVGRWLLVGRHNDGLFCIVDVEGQAKELEFLMSNKVDSP